jgi:hypothetical protein
MFMVQAACIPTRMVPVLEIWAMSPPIPVGVAKQSRSFLLRQLAIHGAIDVVVGFPKLDFVAFEVYDVEEFAVIVGLDRIKHGHAFGAESRHETVHVRDPVIDHKVLGGGGEIRGRLLKRTPLRKTLLGGIRALIPLEDSAVLARIEAQMHFVPFFEGLGVLAFEENAADARDTLKCFGLLRWTYQQ